MQKKDRIETTIEGESKNDHHMSRVLFCFVLLVLGAVRVSCVSSTARGYAAAHRVQLNDLSLFTHTHTHTLIWICGCVCVCVNMHHVRLSNKERQEWRINMFVGCLLNGFHSRLCVLHGAMWAEREVNGYKFEQIRNMQKKNTHTHILRPIVFTVGVGEWKVFTNICDWQTNCIAGVMCLSKSMKRFYV